jgi:hypothetical protein
MLEIVMNCITRAIAEVMHIDVIENCHVFVVVCACRCPLGKHDRCVIIDCYHLMLRVRKGLSFLHAPLYLSHVRKLNI